MLIQRREFLALVGGGTAAGLAGYTGLLSSGGDGGGENGSEDGGQGSGSIAGEELVLTTTTSTYDTGLLDEVNAAFEERFGTPVQAILAGDRRGARDRAQGRLGRRDGPRAKPGGRVHAKRLRDQSPGPDVQRLRDRRARGRSGKH